MSIFFAAPIDQYPYWDKVTTTPTATNEDASYPATNLLTYDPTQVFAATAQSTVITWNMGASRSYDVISLIGTNLTETATLLIETSTNGVAWNTRYNSTALAHVISGQTAQNKAQKLRTNDTLYVGAQTDQYIRLTVNSQVSGLFPTIGRLFVGSRFIPSTGWQYGSQFNFADMSPAQRGDRGAKVMDPIPPIVSATVKMDFLTKAEMQDFIWEFNYWRGAGREILACLNYEDTKWLQKNLLYCTIADGRVISFDSYNVHSAAWVLESIGVG